MNAGDWPVYDFDHVHACASALAARLVGKIRSARSLARFCQIPVFCPNVRVPSDLAQARKETKTRDRCAALRIITAEQTWV
jgi:hypothetical protein